MGGRGKDIGGAFYQIDIDEYLQKVNVNKIIEEAKKSVIVCRWMAHTAAVYHHS